MPLGRFSFTKTYYMVAMIVNTAVVKWRMRFHLNEIVPQYSIFAKDGTFVLLRKLHFKFIQEQVENIKIVVAVLYIIGRSNAIIPLRCLG